MGFKCPICLKDFKQNKIEWEKHIKENHNGEGNKIIVELKSITGEKS